MITVPEGSTAWLTATFKNRQGANEMPASAEYRIDTAEGTEIRPWTAVPNLAEAVEIVLTPEDNQLLEFSRFQTNVVTVHATFGANDERNEPYFYKIRNLINIPKE